MTASKNTRFSWVWRISNVFVYAFHRLQNIVQRIIDAITFIISSVLGFLWGIIEAVSNAYNNVAMLFAFMADCFRRVFHFDYVGFVVWLSTLPKTYYGVCKDKCKKTLWEPTSAAVSNTAKRITRYFIARLQEYAVYIRGFAELCRRLFLFASDFTPGGKYTVTALLIFLAVMFIVKLFSFLQLLLQLFEFAYRIIAFLLYPVFLTLKDILTVFEPILQLVWLAARVIFYAIVSAFQAVANFFWLNLVSISSGLYNCWLSFLNSKAVKLLWGFLAKVMYILLEKFVFVFLPFMSKATCVAFTFLFDISCIAYDNFFTVTVRIAEKFEYLTPSGIASLILIFWASVLTFRFRKRFPGTFCPEIDGSYSAVIASTASSHRERSSTSRSTTTYDSSRRRTKGNEDTSLRYRSKTKEAGESEHAQEEATEGHIHFSSQAHICTEFIQGSCKNGKECGTHHCALPYQWQYRPSLEGWTSFVADDNQRIESLFCDPKNDNVKTSDIRVVLKTYRAQTTSNEIIKLDFENMKLEKSYHRADLRRLSTESYVKQRESVLATQWLWYRKNESGEWTKYGEESENDIKQEEIESAFIRREGHLNFTANGQELRLHFFMSPMCERSFRPYSKKLVRRRPLFRSASAITKLTGKDSKTPTSRFSLKRFINWL